MSEWHTALDEDRARERRDRSLTYGQDISGTQSAGIIAWAAVTRYGRARVAAGIVVMIVGIIIAEYGGQVAIMV